LKETFSEEKLFVSNRFSPADMNKLEVVLGMHLLKGDTSAVRKRVSRLVHHERYDSQTLVINSSRAIYREIEIA